MFKTPANTPDAMAVETPEALIVTELDRMALGAPFSGMIQLSEAALVQQSRHLFGLLEFAGPDVKRGDMEDERDEANVWHATDESIAQQKEATAMCASGFFDDTTAHLRGPMSADVTGKEYCRGEASDDHAHVQRELPLGTVVAAVGENMKNALRALMKIEDMMEERPRLMSILFSRMTEFGMVIMFVPTPELSANPDGPLEGTLRMLQYDIDIDPRHPPMRGWDADPIRAMQITVKAADPDAAIIKQFKTMSALFPRQRAPHSKPLAEAVKGKRVIEDR